MTLTTTEKIADDLSLMISRRVNLTIGTRQDIARLIAKAYEPLVIQQSTFTFTDADRQANADQANRIFKLLRERGYRGATNVELSDIALKYTGRISELRRPPFNCKIICTRESGRITRYVLQSTD